MFQIATEQSWQCVNKLICHSIPDGRWKHYSWFYSTSTKEWHLESGHQEPKMVSVIPGEEKELMDVKNRRAAKLETAVRFHPSRHCWSDSKRILPVLQECQCEEREHHWCFYASGSLSAFQLLPFLQGIQTWAATEVLLKRAQCGVLEAQPAFLTMTFFAWHPWSLMNHFIS